MEQLKSGEQARLPIPADILVVFFPISVMS